MQLSFVAQACRYNVRDVGFVDSDAPAYQLWLYHRGSVPASGGGVLREAAEQTMRESNVAVEWVDLDASAEHPARAFFRLNPADALPQAVLRSPDGQLLPWSFGKGLAVEPGVFTNGLRRLIESPLRQQILRETIRGFGAILLIEGPAEEENRRASEVVRSLIDALRPQLQSLPKPIAQPPALVRLSRAAFEDEGVLLWSLGLKADELSGACVAAFYGKGRWIGPLMRGAEISQANLERIFGLVGADCECGLDLAWTRGTQVPLRWTTEHYGEAVKQLGFDPENPMVKLEIGRILNRQDGPRRTSATLGYQEIDLGTPTSSPATPSSADHSADTIPALPTNIVNPALALRPEPTAHRSVVRTSLLAVGGFGVSAALVAAWLWWRASRRS